MISPHLVLQGRGHDALASLPSSPDAGFLCWVLLGSSEVILDSVVDFKSVFSPQSDGIPEACVPLLPVVFDAPLSMAPLKSSWLQTTGWPLANSAEKEFIARAGGRSQGG